MNAPLHSIAFFDNLDLITLMMIGILIMLQEFIQRNRANRCMHVQINKCTYTCSQKSYMDVFTLLLK